MAASQTSRLWTTAFSKASEHEQWPKFQEIARRENIPLHQADVANTPADPAVPDLDSQRLLEILNSIKTKTEKAKLVQSQSVRKISGQVLFFLNATKDISTAISRLNPYAALGWGILQCLVQSAIKSRAARKLCWDAIEPLTVYITRHQTFPTVYLPPEASAPSQSLLEDALLKLFTSILNCQISIVIQVHSKAAKLKSAFSEASDVPVAALLTKIKENEDELLKLGAVVQRQIDDEHFTQLAGSLETLQNSLSNRENIVGKLAQEVQHLSIEWDRSQYSNILNWISPIKYENAHNKASRKAHPGTADWLFQHSDYQEWVESARDSTFWLRGFMGSGKSCVTHEVISSLLQDTKIQSLLPEKILYFYCDGTDNQASQQLEDVTNIMRCLLKQLVDAGINHPPNEKLIDLYKEHHHKSDPTLNQCIELFSTLMRTITTCFIVIDGLDECPQKVQSSLLESLQLIRPEGECSLKLFFSSRDLPHIEDLLKDIFDFSLDTRKYNEAPLSLVIRDRVNAGVKKPGLRSLYFHAPSGRNQAQDVIAALEKCADGMFRWADIALDYLEASKNYHDMRIRLSKIRTLDGTGSGLFELYQEIWKVQVETLPEESRKALKTALLMLLYGVPLFNPYRRHGVSKYQREAPVEASWFAAAGDLLEADADNLAPAEELYSVTDVVALCPSLLNLRTSTSRALSDNDLVFQSLYIPHFSVREFLVTEHADEYAPVRGHSYLATLCMQFFLQERETSTKSQKLMLAFGYYAYQTWIIHLCRACATGYPSISETVKQDKELEKTFQSFLLDSPATPGFLRWDAFGKNSVLDLSLPLNTPAVSSPFHCEPSSSILARIALDVGYDDPKVNEEMLNVRWEYEFHGAELLLGWNGSGWSIRDAKWSLLVFATLCRSVKAINYLVDRALGVNDLGRNGVALATLCLFGSTTKWLEDSISPALRASKLEMLTCLIQNGCHMLPPELDRAGKNPDLAARRILRQELPWKGDLMIANIVGGFDKDIFDILVTFGYDPSCPEEKFDYLKAAIRSGSKRGVEVLLPLCLKRPRSQRQLTSWLCAAVTSWSGHSDLVDMMLELGADPFLLIDGKTAWETFFCSSPPRKFTAFSSIAASLTAHTVKHDERLWERGSVNSDEDAKRKWTKYFHKIVAGASLETVKQWASDGWDANVECDYDEKDIMLWFYAYPLASDYSNSSEIGTEDNRFLLRAGTYTAYGIARVFKRSDVTEYFQSLDVDLSSPVRLSPPNPQSRLFQSLWKSN